MFCTKCGKDLKGGKFCIYCGAKVSTSNDTVINVRPEEIKEVKREEVKPEPIIQEKIVKEYVYKEPTIDKDACPHCGGKNFIEEVKLVGQADIVAYVSFTHTANVYADICRQCGTLVRTYVKKPEKLVK